jgi:hypothetical protein
MCWNSATGASLLAISPGAGDTCNGGDVVEVGRQKIKIELINIMTLFFKKTFYILKLEKMTIEKMENIYTKLKNIINEQK